MTLITNRVHARVNISMTAPGHHTHMRNAKETFHKLLTTVEWIFIPKIRHGSKEWVVNRKLSRMMARATFLSKAMMMMNRSKAHIMRQSDISHPRFVCRPPLTSTIQKLARSIKCTRIITKWIANRLFWPVLALKICRIISTYVATLGLRQSALAPTFPQPWTLVRTSNLTQIVTWRPSRTMPARMHLVGRIEWLTATVKIAWMIKWVIFLSNPKSWKRKRFKSSIHQRQLLIQTSLKKKGWGCKSEQESRQLKKGKDKNSYDY